VPARTRGAVRRALIPPASAKADARGAGAVSGGGRRAGGVELDPCARISGQ
jgi:hypothetical protein